ncbi:ubiquitin thioesterase ZRANB1-like [Sinocyclocheilus rhinocerous]|uniref:ubiquitin thioesterase ZRANB1-like n=1 Tax=Sinocyclocheilus rhinocerous TaxID=307959 RepID=UPI0007B8FB34|nr:PREDICTED: ubiquitin thioesterase ZRANB1-like [Sinocyclocheilus rhinocerous]
MKELFPSGAGHRCDPVCNDSLLICPDSSARPRVRPAESSEHSGKWSCQVCTYLNWPRAIRCTQCRSVRQRICSPTETPQTSGTGPPADPCEEYNDRNRLHTRAQCWTCSVCSYENWPKSSRCVVCDHPRPNDAFQPRESDEPSSVINERDRGRARGVCSGAQRLSPASSKREAELQIELAAGAQSGNEEIEVDFKKLKQIKNRMRKTDWLFLNACAGVVEGDLSAVEAYKSSGGDIERQLTHTHTILTHLMNAVSYIEDLPPAVQEKLFDEILDRDVQKELEEESAVINWSLELGTRLDSRLYALWNRTAGDCLLDSVLQATWGIYDKDSVLRKALHDCLHDCSHWFYSRWKEWESWYSQSFGLHFSLREEQWQEDWAFILSLASQPGASLEQTHIFVLAHILRRPIIVYGVKYYKSFRGETLGYTRFQGVYLPLLWEQSFCWKSPIALGYTRGHFSALVGMETDGYDNRGAGANLNTDDDITVTFLPLVDSERKLLQIHFLSAQEMGSEEQQERLLRDWLDCCVTDGGMLAALQKSSRRRHHPLITQMLEKWLDGYRQMHPCPTLSDGEDEEDDEDE